MWRRQPFQTLTPRHCRLLVFPRALGPPFQAHGAPLRGSAGATLLFEAYITAHGASSTTKHLNSPPNDLIVFRNI